MVYQNTFRAIFEIKLVIAHRTSEGSGHLVHTNEFLLLVLTFNEYNSVCFCTPFPLDVHQLSLAYEMCDFATNL